MARFKKKILDPDTYTVDGEKVDIPTTRFRKWVRNFNRLKRAGYKVPAPFRHDPKALPIRTVDAKDVDAFNNGGFWERLWVNGEDGSLYGTLEVPDEEKAEKLRKGEITEVSPAIKADFTTGDGNEYDELPTHIALVTHPIAPGQEEFEEEGLAAAMCFSRFDASGNDEERDGWEFQSVGVVTPIPDEPMSATNATLDDAIKVLRDLGLVLPADTTEDNFVEYVVVAGNALRAQHGPVTEQAPPPISMSQDSDMPDKDKTPELTDQQKAGLLFAQNAGRQKYIDRIKGLIDRGLSAEMAEKKLAPMVNDLAINFSSDGELEPTPLDSILDCLEETLPKKKEAGKLDAFMASPMFVEGDKQLFGTEGVDEEDAGSLWDKTDENEGVYSEEDADKLINENPALAARCPN